MVIDPSQCRRCRRWPNVHFWFLAPSRRAMLVTRLPDFRRLQETATMSSGSMSLTAWQALRI